MKKTTKDSGWVGGLTEILNDLGLTGPEQKIFTALLEEREALRVSDIARHTKQNRTNTYGTLSALARRGLVISTESNGVLRYQSIDPELIADHLSRTKERLAGDEKRLLEIIPEIKRVRSGKNTYRPSVKFFEGKEGVKQIYDNILRESISKKVYGFVGTEALYKLMDEDFIRYYLKKRPGKGVHWTTIADESPASEKMRTRDTEELRTTYLLPTGYEYDIELASYDDTTMIVSYDEENPIGITITDKKIANTVKTLVEYIASTLK
jgi:sugar-specific transcriptional regulator TrmB